ncbi:MAG TPA: sigma-54 dependent transcriptional regulator [Thermoanaerobaculia bacterium]|nr:sigma-54 dependent transcriptional regulator [Thermoanaerobaculia bacterium]
MGLGSRVGVVSDDPVLRERASQQLARLGYRVSTAARATDVVRLSQGSPAAILYRAEPGRDPSLRHLETVLEEAGKIPVILFSDGLDRRSATRAVRLGAADCLSGSEGESRLSATIEEVLARAQRSSGSPEGAADDGLGSRGLADDFIAVSPSTVALKRTARRIAESDVTVLIQGESGVGKEVVARYIHRHSTLATSPFVKVNCAAIPEELLESELFGYEKGAFTGASSTKPGQFELANGGTMLLDEISEMRVSLQAKLLGVLQDGGFMRLGGTRQIRCRARICSTTNVSLEQAIEDGSFREDLYFRLKVIDLYVPPLRDRPEDLLAIAGGLLETYSRQYGRTALSLTPTLKRALLSHPWPGNVRELENVLKAAAVMGDVDWALEQLDSGGMRRDRIRRSSPPAAPAESLREVAGRAVKEAERPAIVRALELERWNRRRAARRLAVSYKTLLKKIRLYRIEPADAD